MAQDEQQKVHTGQHFDEGPGNRYAAPYQTIVYGHETTAPPPGLAQAHEVLGWDGDGRDDVLALLRRGGSKPCRR